MTKKIKAKQTNGVNVSRNKSQRPQRTRDIAMEVEGRRHYRMIGAIWAACWLGLGASAQAAPAKSVLEASTKSNAVIQFDASQIANDVGNSYRGDLNETQQYREIFKVLLKRGETAVFELSSPEFDAELQVLSADGTLLASNDDGGIEPKAAKLAFAAPDDRAGTFYLVARSVDNRGGKFLLTATPQRTQMIAPISSIDFGKMVQGRFDKNSTLKVDTQEVVSSYTFETKPGERLLVEAHSSTLDLQLKLLRNGDEVADGATRSAGASLYYPAALGGRHQLDVVSKLGNGGDFELLVKRLPPQRPGKMEKLMIGSTVSGTFGEDSPTISAKSNRPYGSYSIPGEAGDRIALVATLDNVDGSAGYDAPPVTIVIGADTPAGFAEVSNAMSSPGIGTVRKVITYLETGLLQVRVIGRSGAVTALTLSATSDTSAASNSSLASTAN